MFLLALHDLMSCCSNLSACLDSMHRIKGDGSAACGMCSVALHRTLMSYAWRCHVHVCKSRQCTQLLLRWLPNQDLVNNIVKAHPWHWALYIPSQGWHVCDEWLNDCALCICTRHRKAVSKSARCLHWNIKSQRKIEILPPIAKGFAWCNSL